MIESITLENFGPLTNLRWAGLSSLNLIIGGNGAGKTFLLKALYTATKTLEEYGRGNDRRSVAEILFEKLYWTFQQDKIGDLVTKGADKVLSCMVELDGRAFRYQFGRATAKQITSIENHAARRSQISMFFPAKEVLSLHQVILTSRGRDKIFGFDDTYYDLAKLLEQPRMRGRNYATFAASRQKLEDIFDGKVVYDLASKQWQFKRGESEIRNGRDRRGYQESRHARHLAGQPQLGPWLHRFL